MLPDCLPEGSTRLWCTEGSEKGGGGGLAACVSCCQLPEGFLGVDESKPFGKENFPTNNFSLINFQLFTMLSFQLFCFKEAGN